VQNRDTGTTRIGSFVEIVEETRVIVNVEVHGYFLFLQSSIQWCADKMYV
jgi:hypothetical protein